MISPQLFFASDMLVRGVGFEPQFTSTYERKFHWATSGKPTPSRGGVKWDLVPHVNI